MGRHPALTETQAREAALLALGGVRPEILAERFGVSPRTIARYARRERERIRALPREERIAQLFVGR
jgi:DNA-binding CsgD family transcriptional regulator